MRLIDADALIEKCGTWYTEEGPEEGFIGQLKSLIDMQPTVDAVPVVRCKDCRRWDKIDKTPYGYCHACKHGHRTEHWDISIYRTYKGDWYCADGERREDDAKEST